MQKIYSWFVPDYDTHFFEWMINNDTTEYQKKQRDYLLANVASFRTAVDIGGNVGFWSRDFCKKFKHVEIFEPDLSNAECIEVNLKDYQNFNLHKVGLGAKTRKQDLFQSRIASGAHSLHRKQIHDAEVDKTKVQINKLDDYNLNNVDLIKIDTQGSEYDILLGARQTLLRNNCVLNIEIERKSKKNKIKDTLIRSLLSSLGYIETNRFKKKEVIFKKVRKA